MAVMTHRVALRGEAWAWFRHAILLPACAAGGVLAAGAVMMPEASPLATLMWLALNYVLALAASLLCAFRGKVPILPSTG
jgi:hypothetical protein